MMASSPPKRCVNCGRDVPGGADACSFCGALVSPAKRDWQLGQLVMIWLVLVALDLVILHASASEYARNAGPFPMEASVLPRELVKGSQRGRKARQRTQKWGVGND